MIIFDIMGFILGVLGAVLVGRKNKNGFLAFMAHSSCYGVIAVVDGRVGLMFTCIVFFLIDVYYYLQWGKDEI